MKTRLLLLKKSSDKMPKTDKINKPNQKFAVLLTLLLNIKIKKTSIIILPGSKILIKCSIVQIKQFVVK